MERILLLISIVVAIGLAATAALVILSPFILEALRKLHV